MAKAPGRDQLWVWLDDPAFGPLQRIGTLSRGERGSVSFAYRGEWLDYAQAFPLDPELDLLPGEFYPGASNFGVFMDSCPDRWGQLLMQRREVLVAGEEGRTAKNLGPWEFLQGVQDCTRMGALRYSRVGQDGFVADEALSAPPVAKLAELQTIAFEMSKKKPAGVDSDQLKAWLQILVAPGASLGGARPKANVVDQQAHLWIAKFPAADDDYDVAVWEKVLHDLARDCGISVPQSRLVQFGDGFHTFLVKRFDRVGTVRRFFASAMALLQHVDTDDASYLELAEFLATLGEPASLRADLEQLFTRVAFNVATANRDDHLRNHGFLRTPAGWRLAPAFDLNPSFKKEEHVLALDLYQRRPDFALVIQTAGYYRLSKDRAHAIVRQVCQVVAGWEGRARHYGLSRQECLAGAHLFSGGPI